MLNNIIERIRLPFREDRELRSALYDIIGFYPRKMRYYKLALMHKSVGHRAVIENEGKGKKGQAKKLGHKVNNERLEPSYMMAMIYMITRETMKEIPFDF